MGWFDGLFSGGSASTGGSSSDPLAKLDPKLRDFLQKESPLKYQQQEQQQQKQQKLQQQRQNATQRPHNPSQQPTDADPSQPTVPSESLYQDGRYADLWKTYRPLAAVEADTKSEHERLMDVLDAYKDRRAQIGRAALENCALEQIEWNECIKHGPLTSRMTMCNAEMKKFERCYNMQSRLLKALGYLNAYDRSPEMDERIQVHADALFHRMLEQEAAVEKAKAEGRPVPAVDFASNITLPKAAGQAGATTTSVTAGVASLPPIGSDPSIPEDLRKQWSEKLSKLPEAERPAEEAAMRAELAAHAEMSERVTVLRAAQAAAREQRKAEGKATIKDRVSGLFGH
ncbi:hypothetical protein SPBR_07516 [Sporothrix brasiliensis 5110]|uniref:Autophagy-related protein 6 n=1 Tax=Sporothrix brasiliensis 5110 TaxID=1398154 RepID=A0A0C2FBX4_9PEZI|nr:uncharacterized protein SPBR_07516 [Sporothrix brasiliensis 5110]KIH88583.1 hypothetical protein SPBR_07516 [Sporothrix brasiliensis 5110]